MKRVNIISYTRQFAVNSRRSRAYKCSFYNLANKIEEFSNFIGMELFSDSFDDRMMEEFIYYMRSGDKRYKLSTIQTFYKKLSKMLNRAGSNGFNVNYTFQKFTLIAEEPFSIYLTEDEIYRLFSVKGLSQAQHAARERFVIACCTGLRYSDFSKITSENLRGNKITLRTRRTGAFVEIPQHWMVREIIRRNNGELPRLKSHQAFNTIIKRVAKKAGIRKKVLYEQVEGLRMVRKLVEKWELITGHTARRSLATNMHIRGIPTKRVMLITGHKTEESFFRYIKINRAENAEVLSGHDFFKGGRSTQQDSLDLSTNSI